MILKAVYIPPDRSTYLLWKIQIISQSVEDNSSITKLFNSKFILVNDLGDQTDRYNVDKPPTIMDIKLLEICQNHYLHIIKGRFG